MKKTQDIIQQMTDGVRDITLHDKELNDVDVTQIAMALKAVFVNKDVAFFIKQLT